MRIIPELMSKRKKEVWKEGRKQQKERKTGRETRKEGREGEKGEFQEILVTIFISLTRLIIRIIPSI